MGSKYITANESIKFLSGIVESAGMPPDDSILWAKIMTETSLLGFDTHGIRMVERYIDFIDKGGASLEKPEIISQDAAIAIIDARSCMGHLAAWKAMEISAENAKEYGISFTVVKNSGHIGACSIYSKALAERNCVGFCSTTSIAGIAPWGGIKPTVGINPLSVSAPLGGNDYFLLDMSTTVTAMGKVTQARDNGQQIPPGWALDKNGKPTMDPQQVRGGSLLPIGGYKGYGLALAIELLCSALSEGNFADGISSWTMHPESQAGIPFSIIAIDISHFQDADFFKVRIKDWLMKVIDVPKQEGVERIFYPGEIENENHKQRMQEGIPLEDVTVESFNRIARKFSLEEPELLEK